MSPSPSAAPASPRRAVVLGAGVAGLFAAKVLSTAYDEVVVVDRDVLDATDGPRRAVPQGRHIHGLLARGHAIIERLFPGITDELAAEGVPVGDFGTSLRWWFDGRPMKQEHAGLVAVSAARPHLEQRVRSRLRDDATVRFVEGTDIVGLVTDPPSDAEPHGRVRGVRLQRIGDAEASQVGADLVVDATGRGSRMPGWLLELGAAEVETERITIDLTYTTCDFAPPLAVDPIGDGIAEVCVATTSLPRGATLARLRDRYSLSLYGFHGDRPPTDLEGFLAFARSLPVPAIHDAVAGATPMSEPTSFSFPANVRRRFERSRDLPPGLLAVGDAVCAFNPIYAQGMTVAAIGADVLASHVGRGREPEPRAFFRDLGKAVDAPWSLATAGDLAHPRTEGERTLAVKMVNAYLDRLRPAAADDAVLARAFLRVAGLVDSPPAIMRPRVMVRVLAAALRGRTPAVAAATGSSTVSTGR